MDAPVVGGEEERVLRALRVVVDAARLVEGVVIVPRVPDAWYNKER